VEIGAHQRQQRLRVIDRGDAKAGAERENEDNPACVAGGKGSRCHDQYLVDAMGLFFPECGWRGSRAGGKTVIRSTYRQKKMKRQERIDRIELMRTYIRIVEAGSLSGGPADGYHPGDRQPPPAVPGGLLGVELILRTTHAMKLTDDGERCYRTPVRWWMPGWRWRMTCVLPTIGRWGCCGCGRLMLWSAAAAGAAGRISAALSAAVGGVDAE
jgi:hypothetical protein